MAQKRLTIDGIGEVVLQKRRGARSIRLSIGHDGELKLSMPTWTPYKAGEAFIISKSDWIKSQQLTKKSKSFELNDRIGKGHRLRFVHEHREAISSRVGKTEIVVRLPYDLEPSIDEVQKVVRKAAVRALKAEANLLLPRRLHAFARQYGFSYNSVSIKQLKTRWGSCSSKKDIALNCFLMQLPWELIDYVLLHELVHTQIMAHGKPFWDKLGQYVSDLPNKRKAIRSHQPTLLSQE